jgi:ATP-dependent NAD(P)H-hydrate dehydratase
MGADLAHVFCTAGAATVIKSYSPELIVHPVLHESYDTGELGEEDRTEVKEKVMEEVGKWLERFDCIVIGPGLGRDSLLLDCVAEIIVKAKALNIPLVLDGVRLSHFLGLMGFSRAVCLLAARIQSSCFAFPFMLLTT